MLSLLLPAMLGDVVQMMGTPIMVDGPGGLRDLLAQMNAHMRTEAIPRPTPANPCLQVLQPPDSRSRLTPLTSYPPFT